MMPHLLKWPPQASLGASPFAVWKNWRGGIHESTPQPRVKYTVKRNSERKRKTERKNSEEKFGLWESETFYRSKFSRATSVITIHWDRHPISISNLNVVSLFSMKLGKRKRGKEINRRVTVSLLQQVQGGARTTTEVSSGSIGHIVHERGDRESNTRL